MKLFSRDSRGTETDFSYHFSDRNSPENILTNESNNKEDIRWELHERLSFSRGRPCEQTF